MKERVFTEGLSISSFPENQIVGKILHWIDFSFYQKVFWGFQFVDLEIFCMFVEWEFFLFCFCFPIGFGFVLYLGFLLLLLFVLFFIFYFGEWVSLQISTVFQYLLVDSFITEDKPGFHNYFNIAHIF